MCQKVPQYARLLSTFVSGKPFCLLLTEFYGQGDRELADKVTKLTIHLGNNADVIYESGLVNLLFTSGPGGGFTIGSWQEIE